MAKTAGLGAALYVAGYNLSGDTQALGKVSGGPAALDVTDITQYAYSRLGGLRDGGIDWTSYFDPSTSHPVLSALPTSDVHLMFSPIPPLLGGPAACLVSKQINYDGTRGTDGMFTFALSAQANADGLEWGNLLTAGLRTDTTATAGSPFDNGAGYTYGAQAYLQVTAFSGTDVTISVQHATSSGGSYSDLIAFTQVTSGPQAQRASVSNSTTVHEFLKATTTTSGGFTSVSFAVVVAVNTIAGVAF